jgi:NADH dehydrogenase
MATQNESQYLRKKIVIIGAGFGGIFAAMQLTDSPVDITIIDKENHHLFQPLLYQVAGGILSPENVAVPLRSIFAKHHHIESRMELVTSVNKASKQVITEKNTYPYDYLVVATGSTYNFFGNDHWQEHVFTLKSLGGALSLKDHLQTQFEIGISATDKNERTEALTFNIVGAGPTGVEIAGIISEVANKYCSETKQISRKDININLIEGFPKPLGPFSEESSEYARKALDDLQINQLYNTMVKDVKPNLVVTNNGEIRANTIIWAAGVKGVASAKILGIEPARGNKTPVDEYLRLKEDNSIFVIGDTAEAMQDGKPLPGLGSVAKQQGEYTGQALSKLCEDKDSEVKPFTYKDLGIMAIIGKNSAVAEIGSLKFNGFIAWLMWCIIHLFLLVGFRNRVIVLIDWLIAYLGNKFNSRNINRVCFTGPTLND